MKNLIKMSTLPLLICLSLKGKSLASILMRLALSHNKFNYRSYIGSLKRTQKLILTFILAPALATILISCQNLESIPTKTHEENPARGEKSMRPQGSNDTENLVDKDGMSQNISCDGPFWKKTSLEQLTADTCREIKFRTQQFEKGLQEFKEANGEFPESDRILSDLITSNNSLSSNGKKLQRLFRSMPRLTVFARLGGLSSVPRIGEEATVWVGSSGWGLSHLPDGRSFLLNKFNTFSLLDLWKLHIELTIGDPPSSSHITNVKAMFINFEKATKPNEQVNKLPRISSNGYTMKTWVESSDSEKVRVMTQNTILWAETINTEWETIKSELSELKDCLLDL